MGFQQRGLSGGRGQRRPEYFCGIVATGELALVLLLKLLDAVKLLTRKHSAIGMGLVSDLAGRPITCCAMCLSRSNAAGGTCCTASSRRKRTVVGGIPFNPGCLMIRVVKCGGCAGRISVFHSRISLNAIGLRISVRTVSRVRIATINGRVIIGGSAVRVGTRLVHSSRGSILRSLLGGTNNKVRISDSKAVARGNRAVAGIVVRNGRFFLSSPALTAGGVPTGVIRGVGMIRGGSRRTRFANVSSNRRRAILSLDIGPKVFSA